MLDEELVRDLSQIRLDEMSAKYAHQELLKNPQKGARAVDILTLVIPVLFFAPKLIWKTQPALQIIGYVDIVLFVLLLGIAILRKVLNWDELLRDHRVCISKNTRLANQARELMVDENATNEAARWFIRLAKEPDDMEQRLFEELKVEDRQKAYRLALREYFPARADAVCQVCGASVWVLRPGECEACGGTPPERRN